MVLYVVSLYPLYLHMFVTPMNTKEEVAQEWWATSVIGRWAFLTRWGLTLQPLQFAVSLLGEVTNALPLRRVAFAMAVPVASIGIFVAIQFYALVVPNPEPVGRARV